MGTRVGHQHTHGSRVCHDFVYLCLSLWFVVCLCVCVCVSVRLAATGQARHESMPGKLEHGLPKGTGCLPEGTGCPSRA